MCCECITVANKVKWNKNRRIWFLVLCFMHQCASNDVSLAQHTNKPVYIHDIFPSGCCRCTHTHNVPTNYLESWQYSFICYNFRWLCCCCHRTVFRPWHITQTHRYRASFIAQCPKFCSHTSEIEMQKYIKYLFYIQIYYIYLIV